jgi:hypothetical protein
MRHVLLSLLCALPTVGFCDAESSKELLSIYEEHCKLPSDINEHLPHLRNLAKNCPRVVEVGLRTMVSSWGLLQGLSENSAKKRSYIGIDVYIPDAPILDKAKRLARSNGISFRFLHTNDMQVEPIDADLLFLDSMQTYCHVLYELEKFSPRIHKYIAIHDTSEPWGSANDTSYPGNYAEYPAHLNRKKKGVWPAVQDFLKAHPDWTLVKRYINNHGFTILKRNNNPFSASEQE